LDLRNLSNFCSYHVIKLWRTKSGHHGVKLTGPEECSAGGVQRLLKSASVISIGPVFDSSHFLAWHASTVFNR